MLPLPHWGLFLQSPWRLRPLLSTPQQHHSTAPSQGPQHSDCTPSPHPGLALAPPAKLAPAVPSQLLSLFSPSLLPFPVHCAEHSLHIFSFHLHERMIM